MDNSERGDHALSTFKSLSLLSPLIEEKVRRVFIHRIDAGMLVGSGAFSDGWKGFYRKDGAGSSYDGAEGPSVP